MTEMLKVNRTRRHDETGKAESFDEQKRFENHFISSDPGSCRITLQFNTWKRLSRNLIHAEQQSDRASRSPFAERKLDSEFKV